ncbi:ABC transporter ATP-binding protein [Brevibacillus sp. SYSU BS000544]|uniref:ABC transporter ATP-binding protein n=1 Tax=Brevibacillus sp. SYSU BS000544 TaxID=3416443 RepID=UPI003CE55705
MSVREQVAVIETFGLSKQYDGTAGCHNITLQVPKGVVYGFLGPNGAGKSTFVRTLLGLIKPTGGTATILGEPIGSVQARKRIGYLPELFRYPDWLTGRQLLESHADLAKVEVRERKAQINYYLDRVGLSHRADHKIKGYSKGMQQRIGLAAALLGNPELVFLDEPTSALDPIGRKEVRELVAELRDSGKTIFLNSHLLSEVESICDHVAIINRGELVIQGEWRLLGASLPQIDIEIGLEEADTSIWEELRPIVLEARLISRNGERTSWLLTLSEMEQIPALVHGLSSRNVDLYQLNPRKPHLEEIFMQCVSGKGD